MVRYDQTHQESGTHDSIKRENVNQSRGWELESSLHQIRFKSQDCEFKRKQQHFFKFTSTKLFASLLFQGRRSNQVNQAEILLLDSILL